MIRINDNYLKLPGSYLFATIAAKAAAFRKELDNDDIISLGIGDVTQPLCGAVVEAMHKAVDDLSRSESFHGYGPEQGYAFLRQAIADNDYAPRGVKVSADEIFISDGAKSDTGNIGDILSGSCRVAVTDPVYPVYVDSNAMAGRAGDYVGTRWSDIVYLPCVEENGFAPQLPSEKVDVVYLCFPNNPMGTVLTKAELAKWVEYALANEVLIMYDAAYEAFITNPEVPHSIYEIEGAKKVAIEFRSFSKTAGFTGVRCGFVVIPDELSVKVDGSEVKLNSLWKRRQCTKFNGASYISQRAAAAIYTEEGKQQIRETIAYYQQNAAYLKHALEEMGLKVFGGTDAPYLWVATPGGMPSWDFFELLLRQAHIICTPGAGFGPSGEGFVRFTAFGSRESYIEASERLKKLNI
ncbi:MAG: LL-diaminopimelate aminotransferase [Bacteroidales bacterium]|nr:LL-diaminopimelate aminotransferase [Bacteroidales bacterium]